MFVVFCVRVVEAYYIVGHLNKLNSNVNARARESKKGVSYPRHAKNCSYVCTSYRTYVSCSKLIDQS